MSKYFLNRQTPWISIGILFIGYATQGYLLAQAHQPSLIYLLIVIGYVVLQFTISNSRVQQVRDTVMRWVISDAIHLIGILVTAFLTSFVLSYLEIFENLLLVITAEILVRLDLQQKTLNQMQKFTILTLSLTLGLASGWIVNELVA